MNEYKYILFNFQFYYIVIAYVLIYKEYCRFYIDNQQ